MINLHWLNPDPCSDFPPVEDAMTEPDGLLAAGGDLSPERLIKAYQSGIFPWYSAGEPILWWSPDPRFVLYPAHIKISKSLKKTLRTSPIKITMDTAFENVINNCSQQPRKDQPGTWITHEMQQAYINLHRLGHAHSVECWLNDELIGGLYGVHSGQVFCGESMFSKATDASKIALVYLCQFLQHHGFKLIDSQVYTAHLERMGSVMIPRDEYIKTLQQDSKIDLPPNWSESFNHFLESEQAKQN